MSHFFPHRPVRLKARTLLISFAALGGALLWGGVEFFALQWSRLGERFRAHHNLHIR